ncbi:GNAT family N-acetyltransferase [Niallia sp. 03133]|uniref:GNAT family N-acetyltransferase n=1 Tax=Niallia sp. 03133 TaxID=3458060 RepID=UPI004044E344
MKPMDKSSAIHILSWKYEYPYDFYNVKAKEESIAEMLENPYFVVRNTNKEIVGFFCIGYASQVPNGYLFGAYKEGLVDIGFGMKPELTGKGGGSSFLAFILHYIEEEYKGMPIRLTVAEFNKRAIRLYEKFGFVKNKEFDNMATRFQTMVREL